jgi:hypothetical protein
MSLPGANAMQKWPYDAVTLAAQAARTAPQ